MIGVRTGAASRAFLSVVLALTIGGVDSAQRREGDPPPRRISADHAGRVPRRRSPSLQIQHARDLKKMRLGASDSMRAVWSERAVEAYQAVRVHFPEASAICAESAFRAGQLLVVSRDESRAEREFEVARAYGRETEFRARAGLEIGHMARRADEFERALVAYLDVAADSDSAPERRGDAWLFAGDVWRAMGATEDARRAWRRVTTRGVDPRRRIRAFDRLGMLRLDEGDLEAAAGVLHECTSALADAAAQRTHEGDRTRSALRKMRLVDALRHGIAERLRKTTRGSSSEEP